MTVRSWSKGKDYAVILVMAPAKDKGTAFLKRKKEVWNWLPTLERSVKMPSAMMHQSWMDTDFTNDDLVESSVEDDYHHSFKRDTVIRGRDCHVIQMIPKPETTAVWGKLLVCVYKENFIELHTKFYNEDGSLIHVMNAYEVKMMGGRLIPTRIEMIPANKKNQKSEIIYSSIVFDQPLDDAFFLFPY